MKKRDTYIYQLKDGKRIVYIGITDNPDRRALEHKHSRKKFTHVRVKQFPMSRKKAEELEKEFIQRYQRQHRGKSPKYNENKTY